MCCHPPDMWLRSVRLLSTTKPRRSDIPGPFFLSDFPGGIRQFDLKPQGATYRAESVEPWLWQLWATDMAFGSDGAMYVADWVAGWQQPNKGRLPTQSQRFQCG